jgi:DNA polymerase IV
MSRKQQLHRPGPQPGPSADDTEITRAWTLGEPTDLARVIYATAGELYEAAGLERVRLRLVGVRRENLGPADRTPRQLTLDDPGSGWHEAERAVDRVIGRFGAGAVRPATLVRPDDAGDGRGRRGGRR